MIKISPFLWFNDDAEQAVDFYVSVFPQARKLDVLRGPGGDVLTVSFELQGQAVVALNGGPAHKLSEAFSFSIACETQAEIDEYWAKLTEGGSEIMCGWLKDRFGLCWQVVPGRIVELLRHPAAFQAMRTMKKFDIAALEAAAAGE